MAYGIYYDVFAGLIIVAHSLDHVFAASTIPGDSFLCSRLPVYTNNIFIS